MHNERFSEPVFLVSTPHELVFLPLPLLEPLTILAYPVQTVLHRTMDVVGFVVDRVPVDCLEVETELPVACLVVGCHTGKPETNLVVYCWIDDCSLGIRGKVLLGGVVY